MTDKVNPEMLILARESRGYTQTQLAELASVTQGKISKYEGGMLNVSDADLETFCDVLDYPESFFFQTDKRYAFGSSCTYHRRRQSMPINELKALLARLNVFRVQVTRLLEQVEIETDNRFQRYDIDEYNGDAELVAGLVRTSWRLQRGPIPNLIDAIESAGGIVHLCSFESDKIDAISQWLPGMPPIFFVNEDIPGDRCRFTLAHELGHLIMHTLPSEDMEREADRFAAAFLMPAQDIERDLEPVTLPNLARLKLAWRVSISTLLWRAFDLGKISRRQYSSFKAQMNKLGYSVVEPNPIPLEEPALLKRIINLYLTEFGYSVSKLSELVRSKVEAFRAEYSKLLPKESRFYVVKRKQGRSLGYSAG